MFCTECGKPVKESDRFCNGCGVRLAGGAAGKECSNTGTAGNDVMAAIAAALATDNRLSIKREENKIEISSTLANGNWLVGKKKVDYSAKIIADRGQQTITFWEMIKESGSGMGALLSFKTETWSSNGKTISGNVKEQGYGLNGKAIDYNWNYSEIRKKVQGITEGQGWRFHVVLIPPK